MPLKAPALLIVAVLVMPACGLFDEYAEWSNPEVTRRFEALDPSDLNEVRVSSDCGGSTNALVDERRWDELLDHLSSMPAVDSIGQVGPWTNHLFLNIEATEGHYQISFATRPNLDVDIVAIVEGGNSPDEFLSFHDGEMLWDWLSSVQGLFNEPNGA